MRKVISIVCLGVALTLTSCEKWLDVQPKSEIKWDVMFGTEQGFKDALLGCYPDLSENKLYGSELTCTFVEVLAQQYYAKNETGTSYQAAFKYDYTSPTVTNKIDAIWAGLYNVLANVNSVLEAVEVKGDVMSPTVRSLIKAEALSLRGYIYLDLVRLFTWGNLADRSDRDAKLAGLAIPYAKTYDKNIVPQETLGNVLKFIREDLNAAIELFYDYAPDSKKGSRPADYVKIPEDDSFYATNILKYRMSLKAAIGTRMRLSMWEGNFDLAYEDSQTLQSSDYPLSWIDKSADLPTSEEAQDLTFVKEMIFGLQAHERYDKVAKTYFSKYAEDGRTENSQCLTLTKTRGEALYEAETGCAIEDYRYNYWWNERQEDVWGFNKFNEVNGMTNTNNVPLMRSPEVCYTEVECLLRRGGEDNKVKAINRLNFVRGKRGLADELQLPESLSPDEVWDELTKEWRKEFIGDGQMFFYYKRNGVASIPYTKVAGDDKLYVLPLPQQEVDFGGREDLIGRER